MAQNTKLKPLSDAIHKLATNVSRFDERKKLIFLAMLAMRGFHLVKMTYQITDDSALHDFMANTFSVAWELIETAIERGIECCPESQLNEAGIAVGDFLSGKGEDYGPASYLAPSAMMLCIGTCVGHKASRKVIENILSLNTLEIRIVIDDSKNKLSQKQIKEMEKLIEAEFSSYLKIYDYVNEFCPENYSGFLDIDALHKMCDEIVADLYEDADVDNDGDNKASNNVPGLTTKWQ